MSDVSNETLRKLKELKLYRLKYERYRYYRPVGITEKFINAIGSMKYLATAAFLANGVGKTLCGVNILANLCFPQKTKTLSSPYFQSELFKLAREGKFPYPKKVRIIAPANTLKETIIPEMKKWFPKGRYSRFYQTNKEGKTYEAKWITDTGWEINLMTYDQDPAEFESATLGIIWFDEPPPEEIYKANVARLRLGGHIYITATPLMGSAWMYDRFVAGTDKNLHHLFGDVEEACKEHGTRGFLDHDTIVKMVSQYDPDERRARAFGKFQFLSGLIFKKFSNKIHVIEPFELNPEEWCVYEALDTHPRVPDAITYMAVNRKGMKIIVDELFREMDIDTQAATMKRREGEYRVVRRLIEPGAEVVDKHTGKSIAGELNRRGLPHVPGSKRRNAAIKRTKDALNYQYQNGIWIRQPELYVFNTCKVHIHEFTHWQWEDWKGKTAENKGMKEKPKDKDDHMMENVGRLLLDEPVFVPMERPTRSSGQSINSEASLDPY